MQRPRTRDHGFTLIEILIAIVVVGILAAVVVVGVSALTNTSGSAACTGSRDAASAAAVAHYTNTGTFPSTFTDMTSTNPPELTLPSSATVDGTGTIASTSNWTLTLTPGAIGVAPTFTCSGGSGGAAPATSAAGATTTGAGTTTTAGTTTSAATTTTAAGGGGGSPTTAATTTTAAATTTTAAATTTTTAANGTTKCPGTYSGWVGEYYSNQNLTGNPTFCRDDASIAFNWGGGSPKSGFPSDNFSVRWTKTVNFNNGSHVFTLGSDDGGRLYIDGTRVIDSWSDRSYGTDTVTRGLSGTHTIVMEFYENGGAANATLSWT